MTENSTASESAQALLVYASTHGHTTKITDRLARALRGEGLAVDVCEVSVAADADLACYDLIVVAASLHKQHHQRQIVDWAANRRDVLNARPSVFLSVSLSAAEDTREARATTQHCIDEFGDETGWRPTRSEPVAGCLQYREYDVFTRQLMRLLMKRMGHPTDASHDYDYTDWDGLDELGREIAQLAFAGAGAGARA
jgi:menaquinone-dependent protoporphyrinogen oxidase